MQMMASIKKSVFQIETIFYFLIFSLSHLTVIQSYALLAAFKVRSH